MVNERNKMYEGLVNSNINDMISLSVKIKYRMIDQIKNLAKYLGVKGTFECTDIISTMYAFDGMLIQINTLWEKGAICFDTKDETDIVADLEDLEIIQLTKILRDLQYYIENNI